MHNNKNNTNFNWTDDKEHVTIMLIRLLLMSHILKVANTLPALVSYAK